MNLRLLVLFLIVNINLLFAQFDNYNFRYINISDGLSNNNVSSIAQDKFGQLWFATSNGLNKYNGQEFTVYRNVPKDKHSISTSEVSNVLVDRDGYVWAGTYNGLNRYDPKTNKFKRYYRQKKNKHSLTHSLIFCSKEMRGGNIWFGTADGISIYEKKKQRFIRFLYGSKDEGLRRIHDIYIDKNQNIWLSTNAGIIKVVLDKNNKFKVKKYNVDNQNNEIYVNSIIEIAPNILGVATRYRGYLNFNIKTEEFYRPKEYKLPENLDIRDLEIDEDENLWMACTNGLYIVSNTNQASTKQDNYSFQNNIRSIYKGKNGFFWLSTQNAGVITWHKSYQNFFHIKNNNSNNHITNSIVADEDGKVYFATEGGIVNIIDKQGNISEVYKIKTLENNIGHTIKSMFFCVPNLLFIGTTNKGLIVFDIKAKKALDNYFSKELNAYLKNTIINEIKKDSKQNLYIGTFGKGLVKYNLKTKLSSTYNRPKIATNIVKTIVVDDDDNLVVGGMGGVSLIEVNKAGNFNVKNYFKNNPLVVNNVTSVFKDSNNVVWAGTLTMGLYKFNGEKFERAKIPYKDRFSTVNSILEGEKGVLWISTDTGIVKFNSVTGKSFTYNQTSKLIKSFRENASLKVNDNLYFGDSYGVTVFNPKNIIKITEVPKVVLSKLKIKNETVNIGDENKVLTKSLNYTDLLELDYNNSNFSISYALPNYINPNGNKYAYRLKGLDDSWMYTKQTEAFFTLQTAGTYTFQVKAANHDDVWNNRATNVKVIIHPAPWKTWWAYAIYFLLLFGLFYGITWMLQSKARLKNKLELEYLENKRIEDLNTSKLQFFTNISHEFRTPLTLILGPLQNILENYSGSNATYKKLKVIESSANRLLRLINRLMDFRKLESNQLKLSAAEGNIVKFLKEIYLSFSEHAKNGNYNYEFHCNDDEILVYYDRYKLERVFYNLISNAFKYTTEGGDISINIYKKEEHLFVEVRDSGEGIPEEYLDKIFDRFFEIPATNEIEEVYKKGTGIGLSIASNIVKLHHGEISANNFEPKGSIFTVKLKLGRAHLSEDEVLDTFKMSDDVSQYAAQIDVKDIQLTSIPEDLLTENKEYTILVVEDNAVLRSFIKEILKQNYNVLQAENGKVALDKAIKHLPDLIISDVIMPEMVGTELCSKIKTTLATSHIPVILLTSRSSLVYKFEGLESGADDYISKPFNLKEFNLRIHNLLESKKRLKEKFSSSESLSAINLSLTSLDEQLLKKALKIVQDNVSNQGFNIAHFSEELGVSRSMLFTKIKAWTNSTPNDFIQEVRLNHAARMLELNKLSVSEISFEVGFKRPKYFSQIFQKKYGITPSEFSKKFRQEHS
ncbi:hybrid sensor histidine kinase/response regulator transcription factor [Cognatitamlana onchidii]|uniref:hybrid sensor histidine kinase/response regulator transcription factor n=1 Tax=Cognatitamlana onchidii TaxID=2562860 RepID=UPI0010A64507|nr:two-component regulator propeller domain-containing protein [Algibacter onchidii]